MSACGGWFIQSPSKAKASGSRRRPLSDELGGGRRPWLGGVLGTQLHGGEHLLEPCPVVGRDGEWVVARRIELDPVPAAGGRDERDVAFDPDHTRGAVHGDRLV